MLKKKKKTKSPKTETAVTHLILVFRRPKIAGEKNISKPKPNPTDSCLYFITL